MQKNIQLEEGYKDFFNLLDKDQNPYVENTVEWFDWKIGWDIASKESNKWDYSLV